MYIMYIMVTSWDAFDVIMHTHTHLCVPSDTLANTYVEPFPSYQ